MLGYLWLNLNYTSFQDEELGRGGVARMIWRGRSLCESLRRRRMAHTARQDYIIKNIGFALMLHLCYSSCPPSLLLNLLLFLLPSFNSLFHSLFTLFSFSSPPPPIPPSSPSLHRILSAPLCFLSHSPLSPWRTASHLSGWCILATVTSCLSSSRMTQNHLMWTFGQKRAIGGRGRATPASDPNRPDEYID